GFDFEKRAGKHTYTEISPHHLLEVINGFLENESDRFYQGSINTFLEMKERLETRLIPIFEQGKNAATNVWFRASIEKKAELAEQDIPALRDMARSLAPDSHLPSERSWFMEGFCYQDAQELLQYVAWSYAQNMEEGDVS
ncbi:MAG: hypothetical protein L0154_29425, partial [Chloroflexi bacterium]|nr:hypothetical protein [Chloroflexota bacterium]